MSDNGHGYEYKDESAPAEAVASAESAGEQTPVSEPRDETTKSFQDMAQSIEESVSSWLRTHVANSPVSQSTEAWNHINSVLPYLVESMKKILKR